MRGSKWFKRFRTENFEFKDASLSGRRRTVDMAAITAVVDENPSMTVQDINAVLNFSLGSIVKLLKDAEYVSGADVWVTNELSNSNLQQGSLGSGQKQMFDVFLHPPYSPDLTPSDFHIFRSLQHYLSGKKNLLTKRLYKIVFSGFFQKNVNNSGSKGSFVYPIVGRKYLNRMVHTSRTKDA